MGEPESKDEDTLILILLLAIMGTILVMLLLLFLYRRFCRRSPHLQTHISTVGDHRLAYTNRAYNEQTTGPDIHLPFHHPIFLPPGPAVDTAVPQTSRMEYYRSNRSVNQLEHQELSTRQLTVGLRSSHCSYDSSLVDEQHLFTQYDPSVRDLFLPTERSVRKTVSNKLVVTAAHLVDHRGKKLILDNMGISLDIPPGAIPEGESHMISLVLDWDLNDNPNMTPSQALVSPVVYCGPHGLRLREPCTLIYRHCAYDSGDIKIMMSDTEFTHEKQWSVLCDAREEMGQCVVTQEECRVRLDHFSLFTSIQDRPSASPGKKWLQLAVFTCPLQSDVDHYQVRIYLLNKTPCALEWAIQNETEFGGRKCCPEKIFLFRGSGEDMILSLAYLSDMWESIDGNSNMRTPFLSVWHGHCPYVSMCFKRTRTTGFRAEEINIHFLAYQDGYENHKERLIIHMTEDRITASNESTHCCNNPQHGLSTVRVTVQNQHPLAPGVSTVEVTGNKKRGPAVDVAIGSGTGVDLNQINEALADREIFPEELKRKLILLLDPPAPMGNDWRELASKLALDQVIPFLEYNRTSPTLLLLQHMEQKGACLERLFQILEAMGRLDASRPVRQILDTMGITRDQRGLSFPVGPNIIDEEDNIRDGEENQDHSEAYGIT